MLIQRPLVIVTQMPAFQESDVRAYVATVLSLLILLPIPLIMLFVGSEIRKVVIGWNVNVPSPKSQKAKDEATLIKNGDQDHANDDTDTANTDQAAGEGMDDMKSEEEEELLENLVELEMVEDISTLKMKSTNC